MIFINYSIQASQQSGVVQSATERAPLLAKQQQAQGGTQYDVQSQLAQTKSAAPAVQPQSLSSKRSLADGAVPPMKRRNVLDQTKPAALATQQQPTLLQPPAKTAAQTTSRGRQSSVGAGAAKGSATSQYLSQPHALALKTAARIEARAAQASRERNAVAPAPQLATSIQSPKPAAAPSASTALTTLVHALGKGARIMPPSAHASRQSNAATPTATQQQATSAQSLKRTAAQSAAAASEAQAQALAALSAHASRQTNAPATQQQTSSSQHPKRTAAQLAAAAITAQAQALVAARGTASSSSQRSAQHPPNPLVGQRVSAQALAAMAAAGIAAQDAYASRQAAARPPRTARQPNPRDPCEGMVISHSWRFCAISLTKRITKI